MRIKFIFFLILIAVVDYGILYLLNDFNFKYFLILHLFLWVIIGSIWALFQYLKKNNADMIGLGITAGLMIKMFFLLGLFVILHQKLNLSKTQIINFLFISFSYSILFITFLVKEKL